MLTPVLQHETYLPEFPSGFAPLADKLSYAAPTLFSRPPIVLIAEDDPMLRRLLTIVLEQGGCTVTGVANGADAVEQFADGTFDLVLLDIMMPVMDGFSACTLIRTHSSVPIILLSAFSSSEVSTKASFSGASLFLNKPIRPKDLKDQIAQVLPSHLSIQAD